MPTQTDLKKSRRSSTFPNVLFRGLSVTQRQRDALQQVFASNLALPGFSLRCETVDDERRVVLRFADGHELAIRPNGDPA